MSKRMGIIGYPLGHTLSPAFQQPALDHLGIDAVFEVWPTPPDELAERVASLREPDCFGGCVTLPHKQAVMPMLDSIDETASVIGAVNWIVNAEGKLTGHNTDAPGFLRSLREEAGFDPGGCNAVLFGAGGAARAVTYALRDAGCSRLTIANRTVERAEALVADMTSGRFRPRAGSLDRDELADTVPYAELLVNATAMGMAGGPMPEVSPVTADLISSRALAYDVVYSPPMTPFLREAEAAGGRTASGLSMLVYQGVVGFELCTGREAPVDVMTAAMKAAAASSRANR